MQISYNDSVATEVAAMLLEIGAIRLSPDKPFTWASGWNSPIYCDNRLSLSFPEVRTFVKNALAEGIKTNFPDAEVIAGVATAGIPQGALVADLLNLPFMYVRPKPKEHGMGNQIEGKIGAGQKVVVIEDLISTGGSSLKAVDALRQAGANIIGMAAIFSYNFPISLQNFAIKGVPLLCLSNYDYLLQVALDKKLIEPNTLESLTSWRKAPEQWGI